MSNFQRSVKIERGQTIGRILAARKQNRESHAAMRVKCNPFLLTLLLLVALREAAAVPNLRGVGPQDEKYYQTAIIRCRDGSKTFPQERLNDDFCDCADGTDEPGTNACPEGKFYCKNLGHVPVVLFSSRVNDGICDCCDGSDEYDGKVNCPNLCRESGKESTEKLKKKLSTFKDGLVVRKRDVENAQKLRQGHEKELVELKKEEKGLRDIVAKLTVEKEAVEKQEREEKEKERREKEEKDRREKEQQERREKEKAVENENIQEAEEAPSQVEVLPESPTEILHKFADSAATDTEDEELDHLTEADRGRVIASRWTGEDVSDILSKDDAPDHEDRDEDPVVMPEHVEDDDYYIPHYSSSEDVIPMSTIRERSPWWSKLARVPEYILQRFRRVAVDKSEADRIRKEYQESHDKLQGIERKIADLEKRSQYDFGKDGEFYAYYDSCFELKDKKYTYKVCPYKDAIQVESHHTTRLGRWEGFKEEYKEMIFKNGEKCWNGPERSLRVKMRCGSKTELRAVDEPNRCEYVGEFSTPALCTPSKVQALELQFNANFLDDHDEL